MTTLTTENHGNVGKEDDQNTQQSRGFGSREERRHEIAQHHHSEREAQEEEQEQERIAVLEHRS